MDAKVLRAAVSAAIRVTVSTSLISCGGATTGGAGPSSESDAGGTTTSGPTPTTTRGPSPSPYARGGSSTSKEPATATGGATSPPAQAGASSGAAPDMPSVALGGAPETAGGAATGGSSSSACGEPAEACMKTIEGLAWDAKPSSAEQACCTLVLDELNSAPFSDACHVDLFGRFQSATGRGACCNPDKWNNPACTPWGPPVPPEMPREALLAWSAAA